MAIAIGAFGVLSILYALSCMGEFLNRESFIALMKGEINHSITEKIIFLGIPLVQAVGFLALGCVLINNIL